MALHMLLAKILAKVHCEALAVPESPLEVSKLKDAY
jgi:hypothetical protein